MIMSKRINSKLLVLAIAFLVAANVMLWAKDAIEITLSQPTSVQGNQLKAGDYKVSWVSSTPGATVTFSRGKGDTATANAKLVDRPAKYSATQAVYRKNSDGSRALQEIRLGGRNQALVFEE
jgi:hypothetical protein